MCYMLFWSCSHALGGACRGRLRSKKRLGPLRRVRGIGSKDEAKRGTPNIRAYIGPGSAVQQLVSLSIRQLVRAPTVLHARHRLHKASLLRPLIHLHCKGQEPFNVMATSLISLLCRVSIVFPCFCASRCSMSQLWFPTAMLKHIQPVPQSSFF